MDYPQLALDLIQKMYLLRKCKRQKKMGELLSGGSFILQYLLDNGPDVQPNEISSEMSISTARIAAALNNLEDKGFIVREIDKSDRRRILIALTPEGKEVAEKHRQCVYDNVMHMLQCLGEYDAREFVRIMSRLAELSTRAGGFEAGGAKTPDT